MKKFEFLDITTADTAFMAYGKDLNEVFANSGLALFEIMTNTKQIKPELKKIIELKTEDLKSLLFEWLNELIFYFASENLAFSKFDVEIDKKNFKLKAVCSGEIIDSQRHEIRTEVKATTYHKMEVKKERGKWKAKVIVDI
jgi:SHS2 domain-containing protein